MNPDLQTWQMFFDIACTLGGAAAGAVLTTMWKEIKDARKDHAELIDKLPETYGRKDDINRAFDQVMAGLDRIESKLDRKVDKTHGV